MSTPMARPVGADLAAGDEYVKTAAAAEVEHNLAGLQRRQRGGVAARKSHVRAFGKGFEFLDRVTEFARELVGVLRRGTAARDARTAAAGGGVLGDFGVTFAHHPAHGLFLFYGIDIYHNFFMCQLDVLNRGLESSVSRLPAAWPVSSLRAGLQSPFGYRRHWRRQISFKSIFKMAFSRLASALASSVWASDLRTQSSA